MKHLFSLFAFTVMANTLFANTFYVSDGSGSDINPGTRDQPFKTISRGAEMAYPGDTVFVLEGVYRERVAPPRGGTPIFPIVYMAEPGKQVFIKGSDVFDKSWGTFTSNICYANLNQMQFTDDYYWDDANPFKVLSAGNPFGTTGKYTLGQIFVEGQPYDQKDSYASVITKRGCWWYDKQNNRVYVNFKEGHSASSFVEITTRRRIFAPHIMGLSSIHVIGFIMEHCGNQFPVYGQKETAQAGALGLRGGHHWLVKHNIIRYAAGIGLDCGTEIDDRSGDVEYGERFAQPAGAIPKPENNVIEYNYLISNGCNGIVGIRTTNMIVRGNVVAYNNNWQYKLSEEAGMKFHQCVNGLITDNYIADNNTFGIWIDGLYGANGTRVTNNLIVRNSKGIKVELGNYDFGSLLVDHNVLMNNVENQYYSHDASGVLVLNNLIAGTASSSNYGQGVYVQQISDRGTSNSRKNAFYNNIFCDNAYQYDILYPAGKGGGEQRFLGNLYDKNNTSRIMRINNMTNKSNLLELTAAQFKQKVIDDVGGTLPDNAFQNPTSNSDIRANLVLSEWQSFWSKYTTHNDHDAEVVSGLTATYDPASLTVQLNIPATPAKRDNSRWNANTYQLTEETSYPGPFTDIQAGLNVYRPYQSLPPVNSNELPPVPNQPVIPEPDDRIYLLKEHFNKMMLGGDIVGNTQGMTLDESQTPWDVATDPGKKSFPASPVYKTCTQTTLGPNLFDTGMSESYKALRAFTGGWTGSLIYEQPKYITVGSPTGYNCWLATPPLSAISGTTDVNVSFKIGRSASANAGTKVKVSVSGGGTIVADNGATSSSISFLTDRSNTWEEKGFTITGATSSTKIRFDPAVLISGYWSFSLDDIIVTLADNSSSIKRVDAGNPVDISVYPNPAGNDLYFHSKEIILKVDIFNVQGVLVRSIKHPSGSQVSLDGLPSGMYFARFSTQENKTVNLKVNKK